MLTHSGEVGQVAFYFPLKTLIWYYPLSDLRELFEFARDFFSKYPLF